MCDVSLEFVFQQVKEKIKENLEKKNSSYLYEYFSNDSSLVELDDHHAIITTPYTFNKSLMNKHVSYFNDAFKEVLNREISCSVETNEDYQMNSIFVNIDKQLNDNLLPEYTFNNFVEGPSNREARAAALACAMKPGEKMLNPLVIYGNSGLGKTHLLNAIGNYIKENDKDKTLLYISSLDFVNEVVKSTKDNTIEEYKNQLNSVDVLLVDDIQNLSGKPKSNEVFFSIYNQLFNNFKQVVLTSDRPPTQIKDIEDRLKTRFTQGLSVTISSLEYETAYKILLKKLESQSFDLETIDDDVLSFLATNFSSDVRNLEGALNRLIFYSINIFHSDKITLDLALEAFKDQNLNVEGKSESLDFKDIIKVVTDYYGLTEKQLKSKSRTKNISTARHIAMYLSRKLLDASYDKIGEEFGGKDHTTVISAYEKISALVKKDEIYSKIINDLEKKLSK